MSPIKQSIWLLISHSKVFLIILMLFAIFTLFIINTDSLKPLKTLALVLQFNIFFGVYLGGAVVKLKQNYLWKNNQKYKNCILHAFFIIVVSTGIGWMFVLAPLITYSSFIVLMPICLCVFASHFVLGKNLVYKILIPAVPVLIFQLSKFNLSLDVVLSLIFLATLIHSVFMYKNYFYQYHSNQSTKETVKANKVAFMTTGLNYSQMNKINGSLGLIFSKWILKGNKIVDWSVLMPHSRLTLLSLFYALFLFLYHMSIDDPKIQDKLGVFALLMLPNVFIGLVMESRNLLKQTRSYAHVFNGNKHRQLKNKILFALDKNMLVNSTVFVAAIFAIIQILSISLQINLLIISLSVVIAISLAFYPLFMCLNWVNISFTLIGILIIYGAMLYRIIKWVYANPELVLTPLYILSFIGLCIGLRIMTQMVFWQRPMEALYRNK